MKATCASSISIFSDCYKKIDTYNQSHQNNKNGVVFTSVNIARKMTHELNPTINETIFEPAVGSGVFIIALLEFIVEKYNPTPAQFKSYLENKVYFADINSASVEFTTKLLKDFILEAYGVKGLSLSGSTQDSLLNKKYYDVIVGNPPYIRTKNIDKEYLLFLRENFESCQKGNIDIYYAFIELANKYSTRSSLIIPNSYLTNVSAKRLRELIKPHVSFIRDFKEAKQFTASTYTSILMLSKKTDLFSYAKYDEEASLFNRDVLNENTWHIDTSTQTKKYHNRDTKLSDIADIYSGINTNADKLFLIDKSTLENGYYKTTYTNQEFLVEKDICIDLIKISKRFSSNLNQAIIFPYTNINSIIEEKVLSKKYPQVYLYLKSIKFKLIQRDSGNTGKYDAWYAYGRRQGFNTDFTSKTCFLVPIVYRKNKFIYEKYRALNRFIHTSGFVIVPKYGYQKQVIEILKSNDFHEYLEINGKTMPGVDVNFNRISTTTLKKYPYLSSTKSISYAA
jgi:methylase of polypeptide subunit release factors